MSLTDLVLSEYASQKYLGVCVSRVFFFTEPVIFWRAPIIPNPSSPDCYTPELGQWKLVEVSLNNLYMVSAQSVAFQSGFCRLPRSEVFPSWIYSPTRNYLDTIVYVIPI